MLSRRLVLVGWVAASLLAGAAGGQTITFSIDSQGPTTGVPDSFFGTPIDGGSILTPFPPGPLGPNPPAAGPLPPPGLGIAAQPTGAPVTSLGLAPTALGYAELDALSYGHDGEDVLTFSVDEFAVGFLIALGAFNVTTEGAGPLGAGEASADVFAYVGPVAVSPLFGLGNAAVVDGNGLGLTGNLGVGLIEPNPPTPGSYAPPATGPGDSRDPGDNLDALDIDTTLADLSGPVYFSLDSIFPDPLETAGGPPAPNTGSAAANGFVGGDVLLWPGAGGVASLYAPAFMLGLDVLGADTDDLDALALTDRGVVGLFEPGLDSILFSVRRGSAVIGSPDSLIGIPIEEGDILSLPIPAGTVLPSGHVAVGGGFPSIFIGAEALGLATVRSSTATPYGIPNPAWGPDVWADDLDAMDVVNLTVVPLPTAAWMVLPLLAVLGTAGAVRRKRQA